MKATLQAPLLVLLLWHTDWHTTKVWIPAVSAAVEPRSSPADQLPNFTVDADRRVVTRRRPNRNLVVLSCRNSSTLSILAAADFWVTRGTASESFAPLELTETLMSVSVPYLYPSPFLAEIAFTMQPDIEGHFFCGNLSSMIRSGNNVTLLAYPIPQNPYVDCYPANVNESVTLNCPFHRGLLGQYYRFFWIHNYRLIFDSAHPTSIGEGFVANSSDFSLTVPKVSYSHQGMYICRLQVHDPRGGNPFNSPEVSIRLEIESENSTSKVCLLAIFPTTTVLSTTPLIVQSSPSFAILNLKSIESMESLTSSKRVTSLPKFPMITIAVIVFVILVVVVSLVPMSIYAWRKKSVKWKPNDYLNRNVIGNYVHHDNCNEDSLQVWPSSGSSEAPSNISPNVSSDYSLTNTNSHHEVCIAEVHIQATGVGSSLAGSAESYDNLLECAPIIAQSTVPSPGIVASSSIETLVDPQVIQEHSEGLQTLENEAAPASADSAEVAHELVPSNSRAAPADLALRNPPSHSGLSMPLKRQSGLSSTVTSPLNSAINAMSPGSYTYDRSYPGQSADTLVLLQPTEDYHDDSNNFVFLGSTQVLACDSRGGKYELVEQGISVRIPPNALDTVTHIEVGVAIHGSFNFPADRQPISAIVWLLVREAPNFTFKKPVEIQLSHFLNLSNREIDQKVDEFGLGFITTNERTDQRERLVFTEGPRKNVVYMQRSAKVTMQHFCFMCLSAKESVIFEKSRYLLTQVIPAPVTALQWDMHFCISYDLDSFAKMIKDQYSKQNQIMKFTETPFQFAPSTTAGRLQRIKVHCESSTNGWKIAFQNNQQVKKSAVHEIWENDVSDIQAKLKLKAYPPRINATVSGDSAYDNTKTVVSFEGVHDEEGLRREVHFVLPKEYVDNNQERLKFLHSQSEPAPNASPTMEVVRRSVSGPPNPADLSSYESTIPDEPTYKELLEVMKNILGKYSSWPILIQALDIPEDRGQEILQETKGVKTQILRILNTWVDMNRADRSCTRANLARILRQTDDSLIPAARLLEKSSQTCDMNSIEQ